MTEDGTVKCDIPIGPTGIEKTRTVRAAAISYTPKAFRKPSRDTTVKVFWITFLLFACVVGIGLAGQDMRFGEEMMLGNKGLRPADTENGGKSILRDADSIRGVGDFHKACVNALGGNNLIVGLNIRGGETQVCALSAAGDNVPYKAIESAKGFCRILNSAGDKQLANQ